MFEPRAVDTYRHDADNFVAGYKNLLVQIRNGRMTTPALQHIESMGRLALGKHKGPVGAFIVLEESAEVPEAAMRAQQSRVVRGFYEHHARCFAVTVITGVGAKATLLRAVGRVLVMGEPRFAVVSSLREAAAWIGPRVGLAEQELIDLGEWGRRVAKERDTGSLRPRREPP